MRQKEYEQQLKRMIDNLESYKLDEQSFQKFEKIVDTKVKEVRNKIDDLGNGLKNTDNYLEKFQPFN